MHLQTYPDLPAGWRDDALAEKWANVRRVRRVVTGALEIERAEKRIGSSLQAMPTVYLDGDTAAALRDIDLAEISITSGIVIDTGPVPEGAFVIEDVPGVAVMPGLAEGGKCERCWQVLPEVGGEGENADICNRCADAVASVSAAAE